MRDWTDQTEERLGEYSKLQGGTIRGCWKSGPTFSCGSGEIDSETMTVIGLCCAFLLADGLKLSPKSLYSGVELAA